MRIGMISATYDADVINGALRMVALYKSRLEQRGHEVTVFTLGSQAGTDLHAGVVRSPGVRLGDHGYYIALGYTPEAQQMLARMDVVHCHHLLMGLEFAHRYAHCPIVYTNHTRYDLYTGAYTPLPQPAADAVMRRMWPELTALADTVIAPSAGIRAVMDAFGVRCPTVVIENGIDRRLFLAPPQPRTRHDLGIADPEAIVLVYTGRLSAEKGLATLLRQFSVAHGQDPRLHLLLLGKGPQEEALRTMAGQLGPARAVHFAGSVPYGDVGNWLAAADLFVSPSTSEVHPLSVIEAMAAGKPVLAMQSPGMSDLVTDGQTGRLVAHANELAGTIVELAADPARRSQMGRAGQAASARFDIDRTIDLTLDLYAELRKQRPDRDRDEPHGRWSERTERWLTLRSRLATRLGDSTEEVEGTHDR